MSLKVIGAGVGRTGTYSLKLAINELGFGPCHHMEEVIHNQPTQVPLWSAAAAGHADWPAIFDGYHSAVDWPTARFYKELLEAYPSAKFVLTTRNPESWARSFSATIYKLFAIVDKLPQELRPWLDMGRMVVKGTGIPDGLDEDGLKDAFIAHNDAVQAAIPVEQLLVYQVSEGWEPLCSFLNVPVPDHPFPQSNNRTEFWDLVPVEI
jgi:hypothetical protein